MSAEEIPSAIDDLLEEICSAAVNAAPGAEYAGISIADRRTGLERRAATDDLVHEVDALQTRCGEGPSLDVVEGRWVTRSDDLGVDARWLDYGPRAAALGIRSQLRLTLFDEPGRVAGLDLYSSRTGAFDDETAEVVMRLALRAANLLGRVMAHREPVDPVTAAARRRRDEELRVRLVEEDDLSSSMAALWMLPTKGSVLEELLVGVASLAVRAVPRGDGAGLTLREPSRPDVLVMTHPFVGEVDEIQYRLAQGPCITAADTRRTVVAGSLGGDSRWPRFGSTVARLGVHSALSLPLLTPSGLVGTVNVYARTKHAFDERAAELGELFSVPAAVAVENAQLLAVAQRAADSLQRAQGVRAVVDQAVGIMMSRSGENEEQTLERLRLLSQHSHAKLSVVAQGIVEQATKRARSRRGPATD